MFNKTIPDVIINDIFKNQENILQILFNFHLKKQRKDIKVNKIHSIKQVIEFILIYLRVIWELIQGKKL